MTLQEYQEKINNRFPEEDLEVLEYTIMKAPAKVRCKKCNIQYELKSAENFIKKGKKCICKKCINNGSGGRLTLEIFQQKLNEKFPNEELLALNYTLINDKTTVRCLKCNNEYTLEARAFLVPEKERVCKNCLPNKRNIIKKSVNKFLDYINSSEEFELIDDVENMIVNSKTKIKCRCKKCGQINEKNIFCYMKNNSCFCSAGNVKLTQEEYEGWIGNEYTPLSEYKGKEHSIMMRHNLCGFCYKTNARNYSCPKCTSSKGEQSISYFLDTNNIIYEQQYKVNIQEHDLRFDFYIEDYNLFIEYQGLQHFKPVKFFGGQKSFDRQVLYDNYKRQWCKKNNYNLLEIKYDENVIEVLSDYLLKFNDHPEKE